MCIRDRCGAEPRIAAKRSPGAFHQLGGGEAGTLGGERLEDVPDAGEVVNGIVGKQMAAIGDEALDGICLLYTSRCV